MLWTMRDPMVVTTDSAGRKRDRTFYEPLIVEFMKAKQETRNSDYFFDTSDIILDKKNGKIYARIISLNSAPKAVHSTVDKRIDSRELILGNWGLIGMDLSIYKMRKWITIDQIKTQPMLQRRNQ